MLEICLHSVSPDVYSPAIPFYMRILLGGNLDNNLSLRFYKDYDHSALLLVVSISLGY